MANAAILLSAEPYDAAVARPMGRNAAGEGFLRGFLAHADVDRLVFWNAFDQDQEELEALLARLGLGDRPVEWLGAGDRAALAHVGALYVPTPLLQRHAWARRASGGHAYSLTGVTHTIAETTILDEIAALLTAPIEAWDALICPSDAVRHAVESLLESVALHLQQRLGATRIPPAQLVTIPLGVHADDFAASPKARTAQREALGIPDDAPVVLFVGRFDLTTKMHPGPMGLALQAAADRLGREAHWILYGGARRAADEHAFRDAAAAFCPDVRIHVVEHTSPASRDAVFSAADVFLSLSDNVQETFGLTPIEAMAAGLPCVVSDWDGYRDTVRHGVDGFRIRTTTPRPGLGSDLIYAYDQWMMSYGDYVGSAALLTAVDVGEAAEALATLLADPALARRMGQAGQARAREVFDWRVIIPQYQALWDELARRRAAARPQPARDNPYRPDPFRMFAGYASAALAPADTVSLARALTAAEAMELMGRAAVRNEAARLPSPDEAVELLTRLAAGPLTVAALLAETAPERRPFVERGLVWLAKFGFVRLRG